MNEPADSAHQGQLSGKAQNTLLFEHGPRVVALSSLLSSILLCHLGNLPPHFHFAGGWWGGGVLRLATSAVLEPVDEAGAVSAGPETRAWGEVFRGPSRRGWQGWRDGVRNR